MSIPGEALNPPQGPKKIELDVDAREFCKRFGSKLREVLIAAGLDELDMPRVERVSGGVIYPDRGSIGEQSETAIEVGTDRLGPTYKITKTFDRTVETVTIHANVTSVSVETLSGVSIDTSPEVDELVIGALYPLEEARTLEVLQVLRNF